MIPFEPDPAQTGVGKQYVALSRSLVLADEDCIITKDLPARIPEMPGFFVE
jgi:hypothetical protein